MKNIYFSKNFIIILFACIVMFISGSFCVATAKETDSGNTTPSPDQTDYDKTIPTPQFTEAKVNDDGMVILRCTELGEGITYQFMRCDAGSDKWTWTNSMDIPCEMRKTQEKGSTVKYIVRGIREIPDPNYHVYTYGRWSNVVEVTYDPENAGPDPSQFTIDELNQLINYSIPEKEFVTMQEKESIIKAKECYNQLSGAQKEKVNGNKLMDAFNRITELEAMDCLAEGYYDRVHWQITSNYKLLIGEDGKTSDYLFSNLRKEGSWPWFIYKNQIKSAAFLGKVNGNGSHSGMFAWCKSMQSIDLSRFKTSKVTNMHGLFRNCNALINLDLSGFNTQNVTDMGNMFEWCNRQNSLDLSSFETDKVSSMQSMFRYCTNLQTVDLSTFSTINVVKTDHMFSYCYSLHTIYVSNQWDLRNVTNSYRMFLDDTKLPNFNESEIDATHANSGQNGYLTKGHIHKWNEEYTVDKEPTYTEEGSESIHCSVCDAIKDGSSRSIKKKETPQKIILKKANIKKLKTKKLGKAYGKYKGYTLISAKIKSEGECTYQLAVFSSNKGVDDEISTKNLKKRAVTYNEYSYKWRKKNKTLNTLNLYKKLKKGKRYYVRVRSYVKSGGSYYYSPWSDVKKFKCK